MTRSGTRSERVRNGRSDVLDEQQAAGDERRRAARAGRGRDSRPGLAARTAQLERQAGARSPPRDVVVEVAVEPLEPRIEVRREGDEQQLDVDRRRGRMRARAPRSRRSAPARLGRVRAAPRGPRASRTSRLDRLRHAAGPSAPASSPSTCASEMYRPRNRSSGSGSSARRRSTAARTRRLDDREPAEEVGAGTGPAEPRLGVRSAPAGAGPRLIAGPARRGRRTPLTRSWSPARFGGTVVRRAAAPRAGRLERFERPLVPAGRRGVLRRHRRSARPDRRPGQDRRPERSSSGSTTIGAVTTTSSDGLSSPPSADQTSASERSCDGGWATSM